MDYREPKLYYSDENGEKSVQVQCIVTNYKPPVPILNTVGNKPLLGFTHFQDELKSDTKINFSIAFDINTQQDIDNFKEFRIRYSEYFYFVDELNTIYKGKLVNEYNIDMPIEGDIYYVQLELLCGHDISGYKEGDTIGS
ncbi:hypothetical protein G8V03_12155 [Clostridium botulinum D/C]|uniref:hypothetical protein n=1 Tax=Clostridium botulinum TaxID=1491 RepID=UPI0004D960C7|nr:hypothetical protein [Clostridium botulinum]KEI05684.1 hypothetical protein Z954_14855 [Clostridium botulinum C/D str. BKT2873]MCD3351758.1 hypothetical protein [Clostridium botulinum D/C]MCD3360684.1 hypothetical protein [Clostridium botulinum D/C]MCD3362110.1 hypothetical protein [Clostridium botulinum D/C]MCD3366462.1 hypothetical protein [Clostridium botulinum D/C]